MSVEIRSRLSKYQSLTSSVEDTILILMLICLYVNNFFFVGTYHSRPEHLGAVIKVAGHGTEGLAVGPEVVVLAAMRMGQIVGVLRILDQVRGAPQADQLG